MILILSFTTETSILKLSSKHQLISVQPITSLSLLPPLGASSALFGSRVSSNWPDKS
jgi:hypothetical protein